MTVRLKSLANVIAGQSPDSAAVQALSDGLPFIQGNAEFGALYPTPVWETSEAPKRARAGDLLLSVRAPVGALNVADQPLAIGRGVAAVRANRSDHQSWLYWALKSIRPKLVSRATGSTFGAVSAADIGELRLVLPLDPKRIAEYLDHETAEIDALIAELATMKLLLGYRWASFLVESVQGSAVDSAVATDVEVWPAAPSTWMPTRLKSTVSRILGGSWGADIDADHGTRCIRVADFDKVRGAIHDRKPTRRKYDHAAVDRISLAPGDLIIEKSGGGPSASVGNVVIYRGGGGDMYSNFTERLVVSDGVDPEYALRLHQSLYASGVTARSVKQTTGIQNLDGAAYFDEPIFLPDLWTQREIARRVARERQDIDDAIEDIDAAIVLAKERRASLITAAVTGQIDVTAKRRPTLDTIQEAIDETR